MGNAVKSFVKTVAKAAISGAGSAIPIIGGPLASWINSKFAKGCYDIGNPGVDTEGHKTKAVNSPAQLIALVKSNPDEAKKAGLTVDMIKDEVAEAKKEAKAVGGKVLMKCSKGNSNLPNLEFSKERQKEAREVGEAAKRAKAKKEYQEKAKEHAIASGNPNAQQFVNADKKAVGSGGLKVKKPRSAAQIAATKKLVEMNRAKKNKK